jgi:1,4-alpha-glucan branching enzyme
MGNEFGHPEWIDFPRAENNWSYAHARRRWSLRDDGSLRFGVLADFDAQMIRELREIGGDAVALAVNEGDKVLAFCRSDLLFAFNFNPGKSFVDYAVMVPPATSWEWLFDTDEVRFGGQGRIAAGQRYEPLTGMHSGELVQQIRLYLPARTAIVLKRA